jgi:uncharacterized protein YjeT (DUF2065 family)
MPVLADLHAGNPIGMTGTRAPMQPEAMLLPHDPIGWLTLGVCFVLLGLLHAVFPRFMWRTRARGSRLRNPDMSSSPPPPSLTTHRWLGAVTAVVGVILIVLVASNTLR